MAKRSSMKSTGSVSGAYHARKTAEAIINLMPTAMELADSARDGDAWALIRDQLACVLDEINEHYPAAIEHIRRKAKR